MPTDETLRRERLTRLGKMSDADAARVLAEEYGLSEDSVRGRLSRAKHSYKLIQDLTAPPDIDPSVERQQEVLRRSAERWQKRPRGRVRAAFLSDIHFPYQRDDALELTKLILDDFNPHYISAANDLLDNEGYSHWDDPRTPRKKLWSSDVANLRAVERAWYEYIGGSLAVGGMLVQVAGNHDHWYYQHRRSQFGTGEADVADYMEWLDKLGIVQFSDGSTEEVVRLTPNLLWWHGQYVNSSPMLRAKKTLEQFVEGGQASSIVVGHTHRMAWVTGASVGYHGVNFYNSGCLSRLTQVPYLKRDPRGWGLGIVLHEADTNSRYEMGTLVTYEQMGEYLTARFAGKEYRVRYHGD